MTEIGYNSSKIPLGKLGDKTLKAGYSVLKKIEKVILKKDTKGDLFELSSEFYTLIPHSFGMQ